MGADTYFGHWEAAEETTLEIHFCQRFWCTEIEEV